MPFFGFLFFFLFAIFVGVSSLINVWKYVKTRKVIYLKKLGVIWVLPSILVGLALYAHFPITKERVVGLYEIDSSFYPGRNSDWQKEHFTFEITKDDKFLFNEKLKDGSVKTVQGVIEWYRESPPMLFRIVMEQEHELVDQYPALYRGNRKSYYVFESKFGNMFYRKVQ